jgi:hypothetical protein
MNVSEEADNIVALDEVQMFEIVSDVQYVLYDV